MGYGLKVWVERISDAPMSNAGVRSRRLLRRLTRRRLRRSADVGLRARLRVENSSVDSRSCSAVVCGTTSGGASAIVNARSSSTATVSADVAPCDAASNDRSASAALCCSAFTGPVSDVGSVCGWCSNGSTGGAFRAASSAIIASTCSSVSSVITTVESGPECSAIHFAFAAALTAFAFACASCFLQNLV